MNLPESFFHLPGHVGPDPDPDPPIPTPIQTPNGGDGMSVLRWQLNDACPDNFGLVARFFDKTDEGLWPDSTHVYVAESGGSIARPLSCKTGNKICYGAEPDGDPTRYWGVGIDGDQGCEGCCTTCGDVERTINLTCTNR